jgi:hypothetical protein
MSIDDWDDEDDLPQIHYWNVDDAGNVTDAEPPLDLGPCCACGQAGPSVRNIMMLDVRAPGAPVRHGWGCFVCGLPTEGAIAVLCDRCLEEDREIVDVCAGYPAQGIRVSRASCTEPFEHDMSKHQEETYDTTTGTTRR